MGQYIVTSPEGRKYRVTAPAGATPDEVLAYAKRQVTRDGSLAAGRKLLATARDGDSRAVPAGSRMARVADDLGPRPPAPHPTAQSARQEGMALDMARVSGGSSAARADGPGPRYAGAGAARSQRGPWERYGGTDEPAPERNVLAEFRAKYPEYEDFSDSELAHKLHGRFYSDMSFADFARRAGLTGPVANDVLGPSNSPRGVSRERLFDALRNAHAAGDTAAATKLADYIRARTPGPWSKYRDAGEPATPARPSLAQGVARQLGLGARASAEGLAGLPNLIADPLAIAYNEIVADGVNALARAAGAGDVLPRAMLPSQSVSYYLDRAGLPSPETRAERQVQDVSRAVVGSMGTVGAARQIPGAVAQALAARPGMQAVSAATGALAAGTVREGGGGPMAQVAAGLAGGLAPFAPSAATRAVFRGGEAGRQQVARAVDDFAAGGATPSVGQATGRRSLQAVENVAGATPGGGGVMERAARRAQERIGQAVESMAARLSPKADAERAGRTIEQGLEGFAARFRAQADRLYSELDRHMPAGTPVRVERTQRVLDELTSPIAGAERTSKLLTSSKLVAINEALGEDLTNYIRSRTVAPPRNPAGFESMGMAPPMPATGPVGPAVMPYEAIKQLRSKVGKLLAGGQLVDDLPRAELKQLYAALSEDLANAAKAASPQAARAATRANSYWRAGLGRIDGSLGALTQKMQRAGTSPEALFRQIVSDAAEAGTRVRALRKSLTPDEWDIVTAATLRRLGRARPGQQDATGEVFSTETFLTNWARLSQAPAARQAMFGGTRYARMASDLDKIARAAERIREGSRVLANPSGTAARSANIAGAGAVAASAFTGNLAPLGVALALAGTSNRVAALMTSPAFVRWLARSTEVPGRGLQAYIQTLAQVARDEPAHADALQEYALNVGSADLR